MVKRKTKCKVISMLLSGAILSQAISGLAFAESSVKDYGNDFSSAAVIEARNQIAGEINYAGDVDFYKFTPTVSGTYNIGTIGSVDTYGYLYDYNHNQLTYNDDANGSVNFGITYQLSANNIYYIKVRHSNSTGTGSYNIGITLNSHRVFGTAVDIASAQNILGNTGYQYIRTDVSGFVMPTFNSNDIILGGTGTAGGIGNVLLNGGIRLAGLNRDLTAQAVANYASPIKVYGATTDINNAKNILGYGGYKYIYTDQTGFIMPTLTSNDVIVGGTGAIGGVGTSVNLNGAIRLAGTDSTATAAEITKYATSKKVYGTGIDIANAESILGNSGYVYIRTDMPGFRLPIFCSNSIILGGTGAAGGIGNVNMNGAIRLAGANRDLTAQAVANYASPIKVYGATTDINNAKNILGTLGYNYIYTDSPGYVLPTLTANDVVVGGTGATGGVGATVNLNGALRLAGIDSTATAAAISNYAKSKKVYGPKVDLENAQNILGSTGYVYIRTDLPGFTYPKFCSNNIILGGTGTSGGVGNVPLNGAIRLAGKNRDLTAQAIVNYTFPINVYGPTTDISSAKSILGNMGYNYIYTDKPGFVMPTLTANDVVVGGVGASGGVGENVPLNGANRLAGADRYATANAIENYRDAKRVYGASTDIELARSILGNTGYIYIRTDLQGYKLPALCSNNIVVGGTGATGGVGNVPLNGAVRLAGADRYATEKAIRDYLASISGTSTNTPIITTNLIKLALDVIKYGINYIVNGRLESYSPNVNCGNNTLDDVVLKKYKGATAWQTCAQLDADGSGTKLDSSFDQSETSLQDVSGQSLNGDIIPYIVQPLNNQNDVMLGDLGIVIDTTTGQSVYVIYGDCGPAGRIGEASIGLFNHLGYPYLSNGVTIGHDQTDLVYIMFPGSGSACGYGKGKNIPHSYDELKRNAEIYYNKFINGQLQ